MNGVVPVAMEAGRLDAHVAQFGAGDLDPGRIRLLVEASADLQPGLRARAADQLDDHLVADQGLPTPVLGNVGA